MGMVEFANWVCEILSMVRSGRPQKRGPFVPCKRGLKRCRKDHMKIHHVLVLGNIKWPLY
jgi:hypothetical protein